jgi:hypothetical protein
VVSIGKIKFHPKYWTAFFTTTNFVSNVLAPVLHMNNDGMYKTTGLWAFIFLSSGPLLWIPGQISR